MMNFRIGVIYTNMGLVGLNDRDNTNNEKRNENLNAYYGISNYEKIEESQAGGYESHYLSTTIQEISRMYLLHSRDYPPEFYFDFNNVASEFIGCVRQAKKSEGILLSYNRNKSTYNEYISMLFSISESAYGIKKIPKEYFDADYLFYCCKCNWDEARRKIVDFFCSRCEAILALSAEEQVRYPEIVEEIERLEQDLLNKEKEEKIWVKKLSRLKHEMQYSKDADTINNLPKLINYIEENHSALIEEIEKIDRTLSECKKYRLNIWNKIRFYDPSN